MKRYIAISFFILQANLPLVSFAQQQYILTQYMFNGLALNPAYAGSHESLSMTFMSRHQWVGVEGAPTTQALALHGPFKATSNSSAGLLLVKDKFGAIALNNIYGSYAYKISFNQGKQHLSMGLQGGLSTFNVDLSEAHLIDPDDPALTTDNINSVLPNFGMGVYYHGQKIYAGVSLPYVFNNRLNQVGEDLSKQVRHYYLTAGGILNLNHSIKFRPSVLIRYVNGIALNLNVTSSFVFNDVVWFGVTYRIKDSFDFILELQFTEKLRFGYSFDLTTSELSAFTSGSHEFVLNYRLKGKGRKTFHPRYF